MKDKYKERSKSVPKKYLTKDQLSRLTQSEQINMRIWMELGVNPRSNQI